MCDKKPSEVIEENPEGYETFKWSLGLGTLAFILSLTYFLSK